MTDNIVRFLRYHISVFIRQTVLMNNDIDIVVCIMASNLRWTWGDAPPCSFWIGRQHCMFRRHLLPPPLLRVV